MDERKDKHPTIHFERITPRTVRQICKLSETLTPQQRTMVADSALSIAQAHFSENAWMRAIYADDTPGGDRRSVTIPIPVRGEAEPTLGGP